MGEAQEEEQQPTTYEQRQRRRWLDEAARLTVRRVRLRRAAAPSTCCMS